MESAAELPVRMWATKRNGWTTIVVQVENDKPIELLSWPEGFEKAASTSDPVPLVLGEHPKSGPGTGTRTPVMEIPDGDSRWWEVHWRGRITRDVGYEIIRAEHAERAKREFERDHPTREVTKIIVAD